MTYNSRDPSVPWPPVLAQQLEHWHSLTTLTAAEVILEQQRGDGKAFRVKVRLEVPGPGLRTDASDFTLEGALLKATQDLEQQIQARNAKPSRAGKKGAAVHRVENKPVRAASIEKSSGAS